MDTVAVVLRDIDKDDPGNFAERTVYEGEVLYVFKGPTYGCVGDEGTAVSEYGPKEYPFFELPTGALEFSRR